MHALPPTDSPLRELFQISDLVAIGTKKVTPPTLAYALAEVADQAQSYAELGIVSVNYILVGPDGHLVLAELPLAGGHTQLWDFTPNTPEADSLPEAARAQGAAAFAAGIKSAPWADMKLRQLVEQGAAFDPAHENIMAIINGWIAGWHAMNRRFDFPTQAK